MYARCHGKKYFSTWAEPCVQCDQYSFRGDGALVFQYSQSFPGHQCIAPQKK